MGADEYVREMKALFSEAEAMEQRAQVVDLAGGSISQRPLRAGTPMLPAARR